MLRGEGLSLAGRLHGVSVELRPGEVTAICGPNGAGKSSLLAALAALLPLNSGRVELDGADLAAMPLTERARALGYLPQSADLAWDVNVETLVALGRLPWRSGAEADRAAVEQALAALELETLRHRPLSHLSGGERARALLARVLAGQPRWLLADEPLANLDLAHQHALLAHFRTLAGQGLGVAVVLHDLAQAINHADRVLVLAGGRLVDAGLPEQALRADAVARHWGVQAEWLGEPGRRALVVR